MGMDVYGVNPTIRINTKKPERPKDFDKASRKVIDKYFAQEQEYEE